MYKRLQKEKVLKYFEPQNAEEVEICMEKKFF